MNKSKRILLICGGVIAVVVVTILLFVFFGNNNEERPESKTVYLELGEAYMVDIAEIFGVTEEEAKEYVHVRNNINTDKIGTYEATFTKGIETIMVTFVVEDTKSPVVTLNQKYVYYNNSGEIDYTKFATYKDGSDCQQKLSRFTWLAELKVYDEESIKEFTDKIGTETKEQLLAREDNSLLEQGVYSAVYVVTDTFGHQTINEVIVVYDNTTPYFYGEENVPLTIEVKDFSAEWTEDFTSEIHVSDNADGDINKDEWDVSMKLIDATNYKYQVNISLSDRAGNDTTLTYEFSLVLKSPEADTQDTELTQTESQKPDDGNGNGNVGDEPVEVTYTYTDMNKTMYAKSSVNVRDLPTSDGNKLGKLSEGAEVKVTGQCNETKWYQIEYDGKVGYVSNSYLTTEKPKEEPNTGTDNNDGLPAGYSYEDLDGDGLADLPESVEINGINVWMKDISPAFAKFKRQLSEKGMFVVDTFADPKSGELYYYVLAPTYDEAFLFLENWLHERGLDWGYGGGGWWDADTTISYQYFYDVYELEE